MDLHLEVPGELSLQAAHALTEQIEADLRQPRQVQQAQRHDHRTDDARLTLAALDAMEKATGEKDANVVGYCLGGTLLAATLAYMAAKKDERFVSATFLTTMTDFTEAGELSVFIDEEQLAALEERMNKQGYLDGSAMATFE